MPAHTIGDLLASSGELKTLSRRAQRLAALQRVLHDAVPPPLVKATRVKNFRAGTLFVVAENPAAAAKLRQLAPRLLLYLQKRHTEVTGIRVEVQVAKHQFEPPKRSRKRPLGSDAIHDFQRLAAHLRDSPLKAAVTRLVQRHKPHTKSGVD